MKNLKEEAKKRKKKTKTSAPPSPPPSFSSLPNDIAVDCLARISRAHYTRLSLVSRSFRSILSSANLYAVRSHLGKTEQCVYVCLWDPSYQSPQWFTLWTNPNRNVPDSMIKKSKKKTIERVFVPVTSSNIPSLSKAATVGSEIYVIGGLVDDNEPSSTVQILDCCCHTWRKGPSMIVARKNAFTCGYDGKIYVMGGCQGLVGESWAEVFDTKTQTWEGLPDPGTEIPKCSINRIVEIDGKINFGNANKMYAYDTKQSKWDCGDASTSFGRPVECILENVYYILNAGSWWYYMDGYWRLVEGLDSLEKMYNFNGGSRLNTTKKLVSCGGKLVLIWEGYMQHIWDSKKIWCAEVVMEKRDGDEVWGNVEWLGDVCTVPVSCQLLHCLVVSV